MIISNSVSVPVHRRKLSLVCYSSVSPHFPLIWEGLSFPLLSPDQTQTLYQASQYLVNLKRKKSLYFVGRHFYTSEFWMSKVLCILHQLEVLSIRKFQRNYVCVNCNDIFPDIKKPLQCTILKIKLAYTLTVHSCLIENRKLFMENLSYLV